jgi:hypothetical protein
MSMATNNSTPAAARPRARLLLLLAAVAFAGWIGWLAYLAFTATRPIVLSRPQFLASQLDIIGRLTEADGHPAAPVEVEEVVWARDKGFRPEVRQTISLANLPAIERRHGWEGPGDYILPLIKEGDSYLVAPIPSSPGFGPPAGAPRIYRLTPQTRAQLENLRHAH